MVINITEDDREFIIKKYDNKLKIDNNKIEWELNFTATYKKLTLSDAYKLNIILESKENSILPKVVEDWWKINKIAEKYNKKLEDLHINPDSTFCFMVDTEEKQHFKDWIFNFQDFFINILEVYLYGMSFYEKNWNFPWKERAHWFLWYLESYNEWKTSLEELIKKDQQKIIGKNIWIKWHHKCLCWSGKKIRVCHKEILEAFYKLRCLKNS